MRKRILIVAILATSISIFIACEKSDELFENKTDVPLETSEKRDVYSENGYLVFKDFNTVDSVISVLNDMSMESKQAWEKSMQVVSARNQFEKLFSEYEKLESYDQFLKFKTKYAEKLSFNERDEEDCSIDYPFATRYFLPVLNSEGIFKVGLSLIKYTKEDHIVIKNGDLKILNNLWANGDNENVFVFPKLKATDKITKLIHDFPENNPYDPYKSSRWHYVNTTSKRRLINELFIERFRANYKDTDWKEYWITGYKIYFQQRAQKKSWGSWNSYKTRYYADDLKMQIGNNSIKFHDPYSPMTSSERVTGHIVIYNNKSGRIYGFTPPLQGIPAVSFSALTSCQGFGIGELYAIDYAEHKDFENKTGYLWQPAPAYY